MNTQTGAATAHGSGRNAPDPGGSTTTASLRIPVAGGTPSRKTMTGLMTGGSPAMSGNPGNGARDATTSGTLTTAGKCGGVTPATGRATKA